MKPDKIYEGRSTIRMYNCDCMDLMQGKPKKHWDLAIVDPPYGVDYSNSNKGMWRTSKMKSKDWDKVIPTDEYFNYLYKVSMDQIIWGGNNFRLPPTKAYLVWDKGEGFYNRNFSECELAWTSSINLIRKFKYDPLANRDYVHKIHPTQKPIKLYRWILTNYTEESDHILDTHGGSMSLAIACWEEGFDLDICELDEDYFNDAVKRFENHISQTQLF